MVSGAKQLEALQALTRRVAEAGEAAGLTMVHQAAASGGGGGAGAYGDELPPFDAVAHPEGLAGGGGAYGGGGGAGGVGGSAWKPKNTLVRGVFRDLGAAAAAAAAAAPGAGPGDKGAQPDQLPSSARRGGRWA